MGYIFYMIECIHVVMYLKNVLALLHKVSLVTGFGASRQELWCVSLQRIRSSDMC